jgi:predicted dehydrogenase
MRTPRGRGRRGPGVLLVGYGPRGRSWHSELGRVAFVEAVVDPDPAAREAAGRAGLVAHASLPGALASTNADAAIVASPADCHAEQAVACLEAGLAVLVEKPLATSYEDGARVARASEQSGRPALVGQNFRYRAWQLAVQRALPLIGAPRRGVVISARPATVARPAATAMPHGALWDIGVHHLDLLLVRFGSDVTGVRGEARARRGGDPAEVEYVVELEWANGPSVLYRHAEGPPLFHHYEWIEGDRGALAVENNRVNLVSADHRPRRIRARAAVTPERVILDGLLRSIATGEDSPLAAGHNLATIALVEAAVRSIDTAREVDLKEIAR